MSKAIHNTSEALQLGSTGNWNTGMHRSHQEKHQPLGQSNSGGTKKSAPGEAPRQRMCMDFQKINELQPKTQRVDKQTDTQGNLH